MSKVYIKYSFIFDPSDIWRNREQFNLDLANYFLSKGWKAEIIQSQSEYSDEVMVYLDRIEEVKQPNMPKQPVKVLDTLRQTRGFDGKFKKQNA